MKDAALVAWPKDLPRYVQDCFCGDMDAACDMLIGPCSCGAWHDEGEFRFDASTGELLRNGRVVTAYPPRETAP